MPGAKAKKQSAPAAAAAPAEKAASVVPESDLAQIGLLFSASQHSVATHRKNIVNLHAVFLRCAAVTTLTEDGKGMRLTGEKAFGEAFRSAVVYPLGVKKGVEQADRVIKFIAAFVGFSVEHDTKQREGQEEEDDEDDGPASRLVSQLLTYLLKGFQAKNKIARFRCVQLVALMVNSLGEIDDDSYRHLKGALLDRVRDKEATVRMQAVVALSKLQGADEAEESDDDDTEAEATRVTDVLIDVVTHDPAAEVRRAALFNLLPNASTLPALILRTLDVDPINRRSCFTHVLAEIPCLQLSTSQRVEIAGRGLKDREEGVKKAAKKLIGKWAEEVGGLLEFVKLFQIYDGKVGELALEAVFDVKPELIEAVDFGDEFYAALTPETSFIARVYFDYLRARESQFLSELEPVASVLAQSIQGDWTELSISLEGEEHDEGLEGEKESIINELVTMAVSLDYGDEIGRRKMFELMREMLSHSFLPPSLIPRCLDVLLKGTNERDFMRIVVEIVQQLRSDSDLVTSESEAESEFGGTQVGDGDDIGDVTMSVRKRSSNKGKGKARARESTVKGQVHKEKRKELDLRCLVIVKALLERVMGALQENSMLHGLVVDLIVPSVKSKDIEVRAEGLICLGLCCLLDKSMALDSFGLLVKTSQSEDGELQVKVLQTLFDLLVLHGMNFGEERNFGAELIEDDFLKYTLEQEQPEVTATAVVGIAKLMLAGSVTNVEILDRLVLLYFASETADNQELRQCLSYFFPVYCYSNPQNQRRVASVFLATLEVLKGVYDELEDKAAMVAPLQIGLQLLDWTDPQRALASEHVDVDEDVHFDLAVNMVKELYQKEQKDERKLLCQLLPKLYIPDEITDIKVKSLLTLIESLKENRPLADAVSKNALVRFENSLVKTFGERLHALSEEEVEVAPEYKDTQEFIASVISGDYHSSQEEDDDEEEEEDDDDEEEEEAEMHEIEEQEEVAEVAEEEDEEE